MLFGLGATLVLGAVLLRVAWMSGSPAHDRDQPASREWPQGRSRSHRGDAASRSTRTRERHNGCLDRHRAGICLPDRDLTELAGAVPRPSPARPPQCQCFHQRDRRLGMAVDPEGDCLIDGNAKPLTITVPATLHDLNAEIGLYNARVVRDVTGDFDIQVKVVGDFRPGSQSNRAGGIPFNGGGIVVFLDVDSFIRLERGHVEWGILQ